MATSTVIAWWRVVAIIACLAAAVVAPLVLNNNRASLERVNDASQQVLVLQSVRGDVLSAEAAASQALLLTTPGAQPDGGYVARLETAAQKLARASSMAPQDVDALAGANLALTTYTASLSQAMTSGSVEQLGQASQGLQTDLLGRLDEQISTNVVRLEVSTSDQRWLSALVAVPIVVLLMASVIVARRTRRVLNLGLLVGLAISVAIFVLVTQWVTTSAKSVGDARSSGVSQATAVAQAYSAVTEAKATEGRVLLGLTPAEQGTAAYTAATTQAAQLLAKLPNAATDKMTDQLEQMVATHERLVTAPSEQLATLAESAQVPYEALVTWLSAQSDQIGAALDEQLTGHARTIANSTGLVAAGMLLAAFAAGIGLSQPLRRYR